MQYLSIDYLIIYAFLAVSLYIGLRAGRGVKDIRDYAIANKAFGNITLVLGLLTANIAGASVVNGINRVFSEGIIMTVALLSVSISFIISGIFISPKLAKIDDCITMGDLTKRFYGSGSGIIAGGLGLLNSILLVSMEFKVLGVMCESLLGIPSIWGIILVGICVAIYTSYGGIRSVGMTDIFQFIMLSVCIPLIAYVAVEKVGGIPVLLKKVPPERLAIFSHKNFSFYLTLFLIWIIPAGMVDPALIQRWLMAKRGSQLRNMNFIVAVFDPMFRLVIMLIGLSAIALYPNLEKKQVLSNLIYQLLPVGIKGICIAGVMSVGISSISSYLNASGVTLTHDVIRPFYDLRNKPINELKWARLMTILISGIGIYICLEANNILGLAFSALEFVSPILFFPLVAGIMGLKTDKQSFYTALVTTLLAFVLAKIFIPESHEHFSVLVTMATNGMVFFGMHLYINKGLAIRSKQGTDAILKLHKKFIVNLFELLIPNYGNIICQPQNKVHNYKAPYILLETFILINYTLSYFIRTPTLPQLATIILYLRLIGGILCVMLIIREKWVSWLLHYFSCFWHLTVMYCLPFMGTIMLLFTGASIEWVVHIIAIITLLFLLLDWAIAIIIGLLGIVLGYFTYRFMFGIPVMSISFISKYLMVYQGIFGIFIVLFFVRKRQLLFDQIVMDNKRLTAVASVSLYLMKLNNHMNYISSNVTKIRPLNMNSSSMKLRVESNEVEVIYPGIKEKEQAFLTAVQQKSSADIEQVKSALEMIKQYHGSSIRKSGEPYYLYPLEVAQIVLDWNQEEDIILGALLHDTVDDAPMLLENIDMLYGTEVAMIVDYVTHFVNFKNSFYTAKLTNLDNKRILLRATDRKALYIKVADQLHNMRIIECYKKEEKRREIAQDTLNFFVPLAMFLNLEQAAQELLYISNKVLNAKSQ